MGRRIKNIRIKRKRKRKRKIRVFFLILFINIFFCSALIYGEDIFYAIKTFIYRNQALKIDIKTEKNDDLGDMNLNFKNEGSCDVYLRGFVFVYPKNEDNDGTILSNSSMKINYGDKDFWYVGDDNYIYYTKPLKVGDSTQKPMVKSIEINLSDEDKRMLGDVDMTVDIVMEAVQVNNFAYKYQWDMDNMELEDYFKNKSEENQILEGNDVIELNFK